MKFINRLCHSPISLSLSIKGQIIKLLKSQPSPVLMQTEKVCLFLSFPLCLSQTHRWKKKNRTIAYWIRVLAPPFHLLFLHNVIRISLKLIVLGKFFLQRAGRGHTAALEWLNNWKALIPFWLIVLNPERKSITTNYDILCLLNKFSNAIIITLKNSYTNDRNGQRGWRPK